jgi:hypothetical protein
VHQRRVGEQLRALDQADDVQGASLPARPLHALDSHEVLQITLRLFAAAILGRVCNAQPEDDRSNEPPRVIVRRPLVVSPGDPSKGLVPVAQPRNRAPLAIARPVARPGAMFSGLARHGTPDSVPTQVLPHLAAALGVSTAETVRAASETPVAATLDGAAGHALGTRHRFKPLAGRQAPRQELTGACRPQVDFGAEAPLTAPARFGCRAPV